MIGKTLGRYRILEKLGSGGMGEVYRARDASLDRDVALKILPAAAAADPGRRHRFEREAKAVASLQHPNIVTIFSVEEADGILFLTMELVDGATLDAVIPGTGLPLERFFELSLPLAEAVRAAHAQGVIHRDLKPGNVMVDASGRLRVLDFGLAKLVEPGGDATGETVPAAGHSTQQGQIVGTVAYMSPEQAEGRPLDHRSDIFSLGVVLYVMVTGKQPFSGETPISTLSAILKETPAPVTSLRPLPRHLGRIIQRCLEKHPDRRFQTVRDVCNELEGLKHEVESGDVELATGATGIGRAPSSARGAPRWRRAALAVMIALGAILAVAAISWFELRDRSPTGTATPLPSPLTRSAGLEYAGSWSPDGSFFAYTSTATGPLDIYVRSAAGGDPVHLVQSPWDDFAPAWSPDNRWIAFLSSRDGSTGLYLIPPLGGAIRRLADVHMDALTNSWMGLGATPWSPDGGRLVFARAGMTDDAGLWIIDLASGTETRLTRPAPDELDGVASWSPDGQQICFARVRGEAMTLCVVPAAGGTPRPVIGDRSTETMASWSPDSESLVFVANRNGIQNIWSVEVASGKVRRLTSGSIAVNGAVVGRNGDILFNDFSHQTDLYLADIDGTEDRRLTFHTQSNFSARISPGNDRVAYDSNRTGNREIWVLDLDSGRERQITDHPGDDWSPDWSPDGERVLFLSDRSGVTQLWEMDVRGGAARQFGDFQGVRQARWSPDGEGVGVLCLSDEGPVLWLMDAGGDSSRKVLTGALDFDWYRDAGHVVYTPRDAFDEIRVRDLETSRESVLLDAPHYEMAMAPDGSALSYCAGTSHFTMHLARLPLEAAADGMPHPAGTPEALTTGTERWHVHNGGWSPDARRVVYTRDTDAGDIFVLEGVF
jgi:Tol biopolymer transport system component